MVSFGGFVVQQRWVNLAHWLILFPLIGYVSWSQIYNRKVPDAINWTLLALVVVGGLAHAYWFFRRYVQSDPPPAEDLELS